MISSNIATSKRASEGAAISFGESHSRQFAPGSASSRKNPEKIGQVGAENGAKWRFSEGPKRHFAVLGAGGPGSQAAKLPAFTSVDSGCLQPPADRQFPSERHF